MITQQAAVVAVTTDTDRATHERTCIQGAEVASASSAATRRVLG